MIEVELKTDYYGKYYYIKGTNLLHREDGPAVEIANGTKFWYQHGKHHRLDGPAIEYAGGDKWWYLDGQEIDCNSQQQFEKLLKLKVFW